MFLAINDIKEIAVKMTETIGVEYTSYRFSFFRRRISKIFDELHINKVQDFYSLLANKKSADDIAYRMLVADTEMFRDPSMWRQMRKMLIDRQQLNVWLPTLTNGYELFSLLAILKQANVKSPRVVVNSESQQAIDNVRNVVIPAKIHEVGVSNFERLELADDSIDNYVDVVNDGYSFKNSMLENVEFRNKWFLSEAVERYDLIIARNAMIYYDNSLQERAIKRLSESMERNTILCIGVKEQLLYKIPNLNTKASADGLYVKELIV